MREGWVEMTNPANVVRHGKANFRPKDRDSFDLGGVCKCRHAPLNTTQVPVNGLRYTMSPS